MLGLPLVDGVFAMVAVAGVLDSPVGVVLVGTMIFGGSGAITVVLTDFDGEGRSYLPGMASLGVVLAFLAGLQASMAPMAMALMDTATLRLVAVLVLLLVAAQIGSDRLGDRSPRIGLVVLVGLLLSIRPAGGIPALSVDPVLGMAGVTAALLGVLVAGATLVLGSRLRRWLDRDRFRHAGGISLAVLAVSLVLPFPSETSLLILALGILFAVDEGAIRRRFTRARTSSESASEGPFLES